MQTTFAGRRAFALENDTLRLTVLFGGGHIAAVERRDQAINPLWVPPWTSIEPSSYNPARHPEYGEPPEAKLLSGIMGHNVCIDIFGPPSPEEMAAGLTTHGEASIVDYELVQTAPDTLLCRAELPSSQLAFSRTIRLANGSGRVFITESVSNRSIFDRATAWQQHPTLGPPFLEKGKTQFRASVTRSSALNDEREFAWPYYVDAAGNREDLQTFTRAPRSGKFTAHLVDPAQPHGHVVAFSPNHALAFGYVWNRSDFPWLGLWEENSSRDYAPWNGRTTTRGIEFGASPFAEPRRKMMDRGRMFDTPCFRWIPARKEVVARYHLFLEPVQTIDQAVEIAAQIPTEA